MSNPNLAILELVAKALGPVCDDVVFVGGCVAGLLLTLARPDRIRVTEDVDIVAQALTARDYHAIEAKVRAQGFSNDMRPHAPIDRRPELLAESAAAPPELREYLAQAFSQLLADADFNTALAGHLPGDASSQGRLPKLRDALRALANLKP